MKKQIFVLTILSVLILTGCAPEVDIEAEEAAIEAADAACLQAAQAHDAERAVSVCWAEDAVIYPPGMPPVRGTDALRAYVEGAFALPGFSISWQIDEMHVSASGDMAYQIGTNQFTFEGPDGAPVTSHGRALAVWRKQSDGSWRIASEVWNSDLPAGE